MVNSVSAEYTPSEINAATENDKLIALTFDDGPNTTTTNEILDVLEQYGAKATFFLIGDNINEESAVSVKRAYDMGCEIGNHSKTHAHMANMTPSEIADEIAYVDERVYEITGEYTKFFRPPFIATSQTMYDNIEQAFICGLDTRDFMADVTAQQRAETVISSARDGIIVLMHDAAGNEQTVEAVKTIIPELQSQGYEFVTLSELFERQGETPRGDLIYSCVAKYPCSDYSLYKEIFSGEATGDSSWSGWSDTAVLDKTELEALGDTYAIEIEYSSADAPVIALQAWSEASFWSSVQPFYFNGERACFLASDIQAVLDANDMTLSQLDRITVVPYGGNMTMTKASILVKGEEDGSLLGDINDFILGRTDKGEGLDINGDGAVDCFDSALERKNA
ncbi:MAG: hypothetical protein E7497_07490 [Ruminococcus sp.]|nr:hypothetical protein [Ruminococcus sp.]